MGRSTKFDLQLAIGQYLEEINRDDLLTREEREEIIDHLLTETEDLMADGWTKEQAFAMSRERFGETVMISREYERVRPYGAVKRFLVTVLMFYFFMWFFLQMLHFINVLTYRVAGHLDLSLTSTQIFDLTCKILVVGGIIAYLADRLKKRPYFRKAELWLIPVLSFILPHIMFRFWYEVPPGHLYDYQKNIASSLVTNSAVLSVAVFLLLTVVYFVRLFKQRREVDYSPVKQRLSTFLMLFFYLMLMISGVHLMGFVSFYTGELLGLLITSVKVLDLILKFAFVAALATYLTRKLKQQSLFGKVEAALVPVLVLALLAFGDYLYLYFIRTVPAARAFIRFFLTNTSTVISVVIIMLLVSTYVLVFQEQQRLTKSF